MHSSSACRCYSAEGEVAGGVERALHIVYLDARYIVTGHGMGDTVILIAMVVTHDGYRYRCRNYLHVTVGDMEAAPMPSKLPMSGSLTSLNSSNEM